MKKICFITTVSLTLDMFVLDFAKYLHENTDWDITFICNHNDDFEKRIPDYINYHPIKMKRGISLAGIKAMVEMVQYFKKQKFDLIQYSTPNASFYASIAGKMANVPVRLYCQWGMAYVGFKGLKRKIFKLIEKVICHYSTWIEPDSNSNLLFSHQEGLYPECFGSVIWNGSACGVNLKKFDISKKEGYRTLIRNKYNISEEAFVFGFVGRITRDKGINELFEATKRIICDYNNVYLLLVGPEEIDETVNRDLFCWTKSNPNIIYVGFTNVVEQYMSAMDCYILPSYREGFGMSVVEAEAMGVPVIITDIPGPIDAMLENQTGLIVKKQDANSLRMAMEKMLLSPELCLDFSRRGSVYASSCFEQNEFFKRVYEDRRNLLSGRM